MYKDAFTGAKKVSLTFKEATVREVYTIKNRTYNALERIRADLEKTFNESEADKK